MARGDFFSFNVKWGDCDILTTGICNTDLYNKVADTPNSKPYFYILSVNDFASLLDTEIKIDNVLKENGISFNWQAVKFPINYDYISQYPSIKTVYPSIYYVDQYPSETTVSIDGETVPGNIETFTVSAPFRAYRLLYNNERTIPALQLSGSSRGSWYIQYHYLLVPDDFIQDGKINTNSLSTICTITISFIYYDDSKCEAEVGLFRISKNQIDVVKNFFSGKNVTVIETDPFGPGGSSGTGGGDGNFDNTSTPIDIPSLPSISAASTGFITLFNPNLNELNDLAAYLWSDLFEIDGWKKLFADPMDAILGLSIVPVSVPSGGTKVVKVGNIPTGVSLTVASNQFVELDCGSINVNEYWGAYLDYEPYTEAQIYLPYIGTRPISVDEIMGKTVRVVYHVDILTGACCCFVKAGDSVLYTYNGQCSIPIPITSANYMSVVNGIINIGASIGTMVATGGASAPTAVASIASSVVNQMKPRIEKSGSISGPAGVLNMQIPYLILIRPRQALPSKQNEFIGYPSLITVQLAELSGYTEVQSIHLENIPATQEELSEIQSLLEGGVIF